MPDRTSADLSFEDVAKDLSSPLRHYLHRAVSDPALAEDLLQETLLRIARGLPDFDGRASVKTWAYTIATHVAVDHFRRKRPLRPMAADDQTIELEDNAPTPEQHLAIEQMNACVRELVAALPDDYRIAVLLHDFEGLTARETAEACGCTEATAKVRIHRARAKLKQSIENECALYKDANSVLRCHRRN
jgi:RNA polymerase sigma-70 factor, ECF subfamily